MNNACGGVIFLNETLAENNIFLENISLCHNTNFAKILLRLSQSKIEVYSLLLKFNHIGDW